MLSCSSARDEETFGEEETFKTEKEFSEELSVGNSEAYKIEINEQLVAQKLKDLEDYLNLLMDKEIPVEFTANINEQIQNLIYVPDSADANYLKLANWIEKRVAEGQTVQFSKIKIIKESLQEISGTRIFKVSLKARMKKVKNQKVTCSFLLREVDKEFGTDTIKVNELKITGMMVSIE
jgi:hypothetical protein